MAGGRLGSLRRVWGRLRGAYASRWVTSGLAVVSAVLGVLCALTVAQLGDAAAVAATVYLGVVVTLVGWRWRGGSAGETLMGWLVTGSLLLGGLWAVVAAGSAVMDRPVTAPLLLALNAVGFAAVVRLLWARLDHQTLGSTS